jgi:hypothetical protein
MPNSASGEVAGKMKDSDRRAHTLALELIERLSACGGKRVLELGSGRGRNTAALREAGLEVEAVGDDRLLPPPDLKPGVFDGALSTHGYLHGTPDAIAQLVARAAYALKPGAPMLATFASTSDARFGEGVLIAENTYAPSSGDEQDVPHVYYGEETLRELLSRYFAVERLEEVAVDAIVGRWAHTQTPMGTVHWFARVRKRD